MERDSEVIFRYMPVANVTVGKILMIKGRGEGIVRGILTSNYHYETAEGTSIHIADIFRVCLWFGDNKEGASLIPHSPTEFLLLPGWGTYMPRGARESSWQELH